MKARATAGFSLIELLMGLAIGAILLLLAMPGYVQWIADTQVRNGAESVAAGLRDAMTRAIRENTRVEFNIDTTTKTGGWSVRYPGQAALTSASFNEGDDRAELPALAAGRVMPDHL